MPSLIAEEKLTYSQGNNAIVPAEDVYWCWYWKCQIGAHCWNKYLLELHYNICMLCCDMVGPTTRLCDDNASQFSGNGVPNLFTMAHEDIQKKKNMR
jgi:hypothetical protein